MYYFSTLFTVKYGAYNETKIENISIKLATTITKNPQKATMTPTTKATEAMTTTTIKVKNSSRSGRKIINK